MVKIMEPIMGSIMVTLNDPNGNTHCSTSGLACSVSVTCKQQKKKGRKNIPSEPKHGLDATASSMPVVILWVKKGGWSHADHRPCIETVGGTCASAAWSPSLRPCDGTAASASGQAKAGACEDGV